MKIKSFFMLAFLMAATFQLYAQPNDVAQEPGPEPAERSCISLVNVQQICNPDGTVTLNFRVANNGTTTINIITISDGAGWTFSYNTNLWPQSVSGTLITYPAAIQGSLQCFTLLGFSKLGGCCTGRTCIKVTDECCDMDVHVDSTTPASCEGDDGEAVIYMVDGEPDYELEWQNTTTGSQVWYEEYTGPDGGNGAELTNLTPGSYAYTVTDQAGCVRTGTFEIGGSGTCCSEVTTTGSDDCVNNGNGTASISITGGTPLYSGSYSGPESGTFNNVSSPISLTGLQSGTYTYYFIDSKGCSGSGTFVIDDENGDGDCEAFTIYATEEDADWNGGCWETTIVSSVTATITVSLNAFGVPDNATVWINGNIEDEWSAGWYECDDGNDDVVTDQTEARDFNIIPCDVVRIRICGDECRLDEVTDWVVNVTCKTDGGSDFTSGGGRSTDDTSQRTEKTFEEALALGLVSLDSKSTIRSQARNTASKGSLKVSPNPVNEMLTISNYSTKANYKTVRVIDISGKTVLTKDVSAMSNLNMNIDVSSLQLGVYFVEIIDETGDKVVEKISKVE